MAKKTREEKNATQTTVTDIDITTYEGFIHGELVVYDKGTDPLKDGLVLYGFDEVGMFDEQFTSPQYCMIKQESE